MVAGLTVTPFAIANEHLDHFEDKNSVLHFRISSFFEITVGLASIEKKIDTQMKS